MPDARTFFRDIAKHPERFYLVHYSSQSLFEADQNNLSPRITSVVVMHMASRQTISFALHAIAEELSVPKGEVELRYDEIEREILSRFYGFARDRREKYWVHWNMRNLTFGFEHLEHRYRILAKQDPPSIPVEVRINLNDAFKLRYGSDYAPHPHMISLIKLNGEMPPAIMSGGEEAQAFKQQDFIRMNASTIAKVSFFAHAIQLALQGRLKTAGNNIGVLVDNLLESRTSRFVALLATIAGTILGAVGIYVSLAPHLK